MQSVVVTLKRAFWAICLGLAIISFPLPSLALTVHDVPNPRQVYEGWVIDMANLFEPETKATLNQIISKLEAENGTEIAIVTVPDTSPADTPKQFATQLFNYWGIGKTKINNGVLFLVSKDDRRVEIDTGYGIEKILPNAQVRNIIDQLIIPHFKQGDFAGGTLAGIQALTNALEIHDILATTTPINSKHQPDFTAYIGLFLVIGAIVAVTVWAIVGIIQADNDDRPRPRRDGWSNGGWSDGGGGGGGSGDGGGGGSGDGGAGGSW